MKKEIEDASVELIIKAKPETKQIDIDIKLVEQILINLVKNSLFALVGIDSGKITLNAFFDKTGRTVIQVIDNGKGIPAEQIDEIFIPFYTTKEKGSGIGLSFSRQVMKLHGGTISAFSKPNDETIFTLRF